MYEIPIIKQQYTTECQPHLMKDSMTELTVICTVDTEREKLTCQASGDILVHQQQPQNVKTLALKWAIKKD